MLRLHIYTQIKIIGPVRKLTRELNVDCVIQSKVTLSKMTKSVGGLEITWKVAFFLSLKLPHDDRISNRITLRIVGYHFTSRLTAILNLCSIYLKLLDDVL